MIETLASRLNRPPAAARRNSLFKIAAGMFLWVSLFVFLPWILLGAITWIGVAVAGPVLFATASWLAANVSLVHVTSLTATGVICFCLFAWAARLLRPIDLAMLRPPDLSLAHALFQIRRSKLARSAAPLHGLASGP